MKALFLPIFLSFLSGYAVAGSTRFDFRDAIQRNSLEITLQGPLERTTALSHFVSGWAELDLENVSAGIRGEIDFDTRTLETGIEGKNVYLKERLLDSTQFPLFQAAFMKVIPPVKGKPSDAEGAKFKTEIGFKFKGQAKTLQLPVHVQYFKESELTRQRLPGNLLSITSDSEIGLDKLGITIPEGFKSAAASNVRVVLHMVGSDRLPVGAASLPDGFKPKEPTPGAPAKKTE